MPRSIVIVGAGLAGAKAAETLRQQGYDGRITLIGAEPERPYERPPLSKGLLLGQTARHEVFVHSPQWYGANEVELRTGTEATGIDLSARRVGLHTGESIAFDRLLLATGSAPRRLSVPGAELEGVHSLRTLTDAEALAGALHDGVRVAIIGGGWIGMEVAAAARAHKAHVTVIEAASLPLLAVLGEQVARTFAELHAEHGVEFRFGAQVTELHRAASVKSVGLRDGSAVPADLVIIGVGAVPNDQLAARAGLEVSNGIVVDAGLRTSDPHVFAAGDVARVYHPRLGKHLRIEHWANALAGGADAGRAMLGLPVEPERVPFFYTDQYDLGAEYAGYVDPGDAASVVFRGDPDKREFIAFWTRDGRILAGMNVNVWDVTEQIQALIRGGRRTDMTRLADPRIPLDAI